ncbi:MAG TPA: hypothetical protein VEY51_03630 [Chondromyces sp.]|nr:hypothetical protein [Chondromyces sp.]
MGKGGFIKIILTLSVLTAYFIGFSYYSANAYEKIFNLSAGFDEGTKIGPLDLSYKTKAEAVDLLRNQTEEWKKEKKVTLEYVEKTTSVDSSLFEFQIQQSVSETVSGQGTPLISTIEEEVLQQLISQEFPENISDYLDYTALASDLQDIASFLQEGESVMDLSLYLDKQKKQEVIAEAWGSKETVTADLQQFVTENPSVKLKGRTAFSFLQWIEGTEYTSLNIEDMNMLSSLFYRLVLQTNFSIFEKNQSEQLPSFIELGYEANVNLVKDLDFIFMNENQVDYTVELQVVNDKLYGAVKGIPFVYQYEPMLKNKKLLEPKKILKFTPDLPYGHMEVEKEGEKGQMIQMYRAIYGIEGHLLKEEWVSEDFYLPVHRVEMYSSLEPPPPEPEETVENPDGKTADEQKETEEEAEVESGEESVKEKNGEESEPSDEKTKAPDEEATEESVDVPNQQPPSPTK